MHGWCEAQSVPRWDGIPLDYFVPENSPIGFFIGSISVANTAGRRVNVKFQPTYISATRTGDAQFNLAMATVFDFERLTDSRVQLTCFLSFEGDSNSETQRSFWIIVQNVNDNYPEFVGIPYITDVSEYSEVGTAVFNISARDADADDVIEYSFESGSESGSFRINPLTGSITLTKKFDYEQEKIVQLAVFATDGYQELPSPRTRNRSKQILIINVIDEQDQPPIFLGLPYIKSVVEELPQGSYVITVSAQDGDRGKPRAITYAFKQPDGLPTDSTADGYFYINASSGVITIKSKIDRDIPSVKERGGVFSLTVQAREVIPEGSREQFSEINDSSSVEVTISVLDIDDNPPRFNTHITTAWIDENAQVDLPVNFNEALSVTDPDNLENGTFELFITTGNAAYEDLYVKPNRSQTDSPVLVYVKNSSAFDYEKVKSVTFQIYAKSITSPTKSDVVNVTLQIRDVNDNSPKFNELEYVASVAENSPSGTFVITMHATDADSGLFGNIKYSLQGGSERFYIDSSNGSVFVKCNDCIDREKVSGYFLTVVATDGGQLTGVASLAVNVIDMNDNPPRFLKTGYTAYLKENAEIFQEEVRLEARDDDEPEKDNSAIVYSLSGQYSEHFNIDATTGVVSVSRPLDIEEFDRQARDVTLRITVTAADKGNPVLSNSTILTITLEDVNDKKPYFIDLPTSVQVQEDIARGSFIFKVLTQDDDFSPPNNQVNYRIESGASEKFQISSVSGEITIIGELDRETQSNYSLEISATDRGTPSFENVSRLYVEVSDVNDVSPTMNERTYSFSVKEDAILSNVVGSVSASDPDLNHLLVYRILPTGMLGYDAASARLTGFNESQNPFAINRTSGGIFIAKSLDRETISRVTFIVEVEDVNAELKKPQLDTVPITINILDVVDSVPKFNPDRFYKAAVRDMKSGVTILKLQDYLTVFDQTNDVEYKIQEFTETGNLGSPPPFSVARTGEITTTAVIPQNAVGTVKFEARAINSASLFAKANVEIVIISSSHILTLTVNKPEQEVKETVEQLIIEPYRRLTGVNLTIASIERNPLNQESTDVSVYSMKSDSEPKPSKELYQYIEDIPSLRQALEAANVQSVVRPTDPPVIKTDFYVAVGVCGLLAIVLVATIVGFLVAQRKLRWKLKAASAATDRGGARRRSEAAGLPNTNAFSKGNPLYQANGQQSNGFGLSKEDEAGTFESSLDNGGYYNSGNGHAMDLLGDDRKQAKPIDHQAVLQALMTERQATGGAARGGLPSASAADVSGSSKMANARVSVHETTDI